MIKRVCNDNSCILLLFVIFNFVQNDKGVVHRKNKIIYLSAEFDRNGVSFPILQSRVNLSLQWKSNIQQLILRINQFGFTFYLHMQIRKQCNLVASFWLQLDKTYTHPRLSVTFNWIFSPNYLCFTPQHHLLCKESRDVLRETFHSTTNQFAHQIWSAGWVIACTSWYFLPFIRFNQRFPYLLISSNKYLSMFR